MTDTTTSTAKATASERAERMLAGIVQKGDLRPRAEVLMQCVLEALVEATDRIAALEKQGEIAGRVMTFAGPHDPGREYRPGAVVQRQGSTWVCLVTTAEAPGASSAWRRISGVSQ